MKDDTEFYLKFSNEICDCKDQLYNLMIYGIDFPCVHTILSKLILSKFFKNFFDDYRFDHQIRLISLYEEKKIQKTQLNLKKINY